MDELINEIVARTGMSREQAALAAGITIEYIKARVSIQARGEIDTLFVGQAVSETVSKVAGDIERTFK